MKYQVIIFDADGVTLKAGRNFSYIYSEKFGVPIEKLSPFFKGVFQDCMIGKADLKEELKKVLSDWNWTGTVEELLELWFSSEDRVDQKITDLIKGLRKDDIKCFMTTNQEKYRGQHLRNQLKDIFDDIFVSAELGYKKKDLGFYEQVFEQIGPSVAGDKTQVLFIDDEEENVKMAQKFGFDTLHYKEFQGSDEIKSLLV